MARLGGDGRAHEVFVELALARGPTAEEPEVFLQGRDGGAEEFAQGIEADREEQEVVAAGGLEAGRDGNSGSACRFISDAKECDGAGNEGEPGFGRDEEALANAVDYEVERGGLQ
jgi:hypothetical protein